MTLRKILAAALVALLVSSCQVPDSTKPTPQSFQQRAPRIHYGNSSWQYADVYNPQQRPRGVIVLVHGGAWMAGSTSWSEIPSWIRSQQSSGWVLVSVSYRMGTGHVVDGMVNDVITAVSYVKRSRPYQGLPVFVAGHSAGATLAMRSALGNTDVSGLVLAAAPLEFRQMATSASSVFGYRLSYVVNNALGCGGAFNGPNMCGEPVLSRYDLTTEQIRSLPPVYLAAGGLDRVVLPEWSRDWYGELVSVKGDSQVWFDYVENAEHSLEGANFEFLNLFLDMFSKR